MASDDEKLDVLKSRYEQAVQKKNYVRQQTNDTNVHKKADDDADKANKDYTDAMMRQQSKGKTPNTGAASDLLKMLGGR